MSPRRSPLLAAAALAGLLGACTVPPPEAYTSLSGTRTAESRPAGPDARGENCIAQPGRAPVLDLPVTAAQEVFCGGWTQPSARIYALRGSSTGAELDQIAAGGIWRRWVEERVTCGAVEQTRLVDGTPAVVLRCTRRQGGWPHVAVVTQGANGPVVADGIPSALPVMERLARGIAPPAAGTATARSDALQIEVVRLSSRAFGSNDIRDYERAMALGQELNIAEDYAGAEDAYRAALAIQERVLGAGNPNTVGPLVHLALNLSNQHRFREADVLFQRAGGLVRGAADPLAPARLLHYRGLHALNQGRYGDAGNLLAQAETLYQGFVPASLLGRSAPDSLSGTGLASPTTQSAVMGLAEVRRARATVLARSGAGDEAIALNSSARDLLRRVSFDRGVITGRSLRTEAAALGSGRNPGRAGDLLEQAALRIGQSAPGQQRAEARTLFLAGQQRLEAGRTEAALANFRAGAAILRERRLSLEPDQVLAYLDALAAQAARDPAAAPALQREMFGAVQFAQRGQTVRFVTQSAARLAAGGGDARASDAVRRLQDIDRELREMFAVRDALGATASPTARADLDRRIDERLRAREETESEVAAAAPGYRQLLLGAVTAGDAAAVLAPREVMVQILLGARHGYTLAVRPDGSVLARRIDLGDGAAATLVARIRSGIDQPAVRGARGFDTAAAHELHAKLFGPVAPALEGAERLTVIPDGPLLAIPFGLLLAEPADPAALGRAAWLVRRHAIVHATSAQAVVTLRNLSPASAAPRAYVGFGDFDPPSAAQLARSFPADRCAEDARLAAGLVRLPGTREEVRIAAQLARADARSTYFGTAFTRAGLRAADLGTHRIIHLATHALLPGELSCVTEPSVVLTPLPGAPDAASAFLRASEVLDMRLDADLVILSACNTAGPASGVAGAAGSAGEALSGLARSFFYAGARGLLVTHWPAVDQAAAITVADMMRRQEAGADSATALRGAQLVLLDEAGRGLPEFYAHPYYWAGFALIGDGRRGAPGRVAAAGQAAPAM
ncbi:CHAT domain-containing protein [Falsiroseomonas oryzae]|uniref:CHAT domain-containing protein n=1 Tax=Falsiroseomonas oryzae TaxID=2766473 RepID=UPI0022EB640F|nr:CHAT domain-containing protein [Roseomonas sp. MO-31]